MSRQSLSIINEDWLANEAGPSSTPEYRAVPAIVHSANCRFASLFPFERLHSRLSCSFNRSYPPAYWWLNDVGKAPII